MGMANAAGQALDQLAAVVRETDEIRIARILLPPDARVVGDNGVITTGRPVLVELGAQALDGLTVAEPAHRHQHAGRPDHPDIAAEDADGIDAGADEEIVPGILAAGLAIEPIRPPGRRRKPCSSTPPAFSYIPYS